MLVLIKYAVVCGLPLLCGLLSDLDGSYKKTEFQKFSKYELYKKKQS